MTTHLVTPDDPWGASQDFDAYMRDTSPGAPITIVSQRMLPAIHFPDGTVSYGYRCTKSCGHEDDYSIAEGRAMGDMVGVAVDSCGQCERGAL